MRNWFKKLLARTEVRVVIVPRDPCRLRLSEWQSSPDLVRLARKYLDNPELRRMLDVLRNEALAHATITAPIPLDQRAIWQARAEGYSIALNNLEAMGQEFKKKEALTATYEDPEEEFIEPQSTTD